MSDINLLAAHDTLKLLIGEQGIALFDSVYAVVDAAEKRGHKDGWAKGWVTGYDRGYTDADEEASFRAGWSYGFDAGVKSARSPFFKEALAIEAGPDVEEHYAEEDAIELTDQSAFDREFEALPDAYLLDEEFDAVAENDVATINRVNRFE
jgi:hypothetical protein